VSGDDVKKRLKVTAGTVAVKHAAVIHFDFCGAQPNRIANRGIVMAARALLTGAGVRLREALPDIRQSTAAAVAA
jgi:hypothetical protein